MLDTKETKRHRKNDPESFLSRVTIVVEGVSEQGFATAILERAFGSPLKDHGVHINDGGGHEATLDLLEALAKSGLRFGGFADGEGKHPTRWAETEKKLGNILFRWTSGHLEENVLSALPDDKLLQLLIDPEEQKTGERLRTTDTPILHLRSPLF